METPVAAPAAAPAAVSAPASTLASTPAPSSSPAAATTTVDSSAVAATTTSTSSATVTETLGTPSTESTPAATDAPGKPDRAAYGDDIEKFLRDTYAWEEQNPDGTEFVTGDEIPIDPEAAETPAEPTEQTEQTEETKTEETAKTPEVEAPTPEALAKLIETTPALKAVIEAHPEVKGALFAMGRKIAVAEPILKIVPNVEAAQFAVDHANQFVGLKTALQLSDSPEKMKEAAGQFLEQFALVGADGKPVLDAKGNPTYGDDLPLFVSEIKNRDNAVRIDDLKSRISAGQYTTPQGKENDEQLLAAYEFIAAAEAAGPEELDKPDLSGLTPEAKAYLQKREAEMDAERERLGLKTKEFTAKERAAVRERLDQQYRSEFGASTGKYLTNYLQQKEKDGVVIPQYLLAHQITHPKTGQKVSVFALDVFEKLNAKLGSLPTVKAHSATLQMNAINDQGLAARVQYGQGLIDEYLPGIIDEVLTQSGIELAKSASNKIAAREERRSDARVEPAAGGPVNPRAMSDKQLMEMARGNVEKKFPNIDAGRKIEETLKERDRLQSQR